MDKPDKIQKGVKSLLRLTFGAGVYHGIDKKVIDAAILILANAEDDSLKRELNKYYELKSEYDMLIQDLKDFKSGDAYFKMCEVRDMKMMKVQLRTRKFIVLENIFKETCKVAQEVDMFDKVFATFELKGLPLTFMDGDDQREYIDQPENREPGMEQEEEELNI